MTSTRIGEGPGIDIGDTRRHRHRFGTAVEAKKAGERRAAFSRMADFSPQAFDELHLAKVGRHDIRHHVRLIQRILHRLGGVPEAEHPVAAAIVYDRPFEADDPRSGGTCRNIGVDGVLSVEVRQASVRMPDLVALVQRQVVGVRLLQLDKARIGSLYGDPKSPLLAEKIQDHIVGETGGQRGTAEIPHFLQVSEMRSGIARFGDLRHWGEFLAVAEARTISNARCRGIVAGPLESL